MGQRWLTAPHRPATTCRDTGTGWLCRRLQIPGPGSSRWPYCFSPEGRKQRRRESPLGPTSHVQQSCRLKYWTDTVVLSLTETHMDNLIYPSNWILWFYCRAVIYRLSDGICWPSSMRCYGNNRHHHSLLTVQRRGNIITVYQLAGSRFPLSPCLPFLLLWCHIRWF